MLLLTQMTQLNSIGADLNAPQAQVWILTSLVIVQATIGPIISTASDLFQARKSILVGSCTIAVIGCAIAPRSSSVYQVIAAQILIGFGFASVPLAYCVPSEIVPNKWRPSKLQFLRNRRSCD